MAICVFHGWRGEGGASWPLFTCTFHKQARKARQQINSGAVADEPDAASQQVHHGRSRESETERKRPVSSSYCPIVDEIIQQRFGTSAIFEFLNKNNR